ncbi:MAG: SusC/RagA family TonB-linked outer membrane protein [Muribaculaceae bacterium]|nr:SusC/RagA family TonB-linked outer membrane protein [Muribaculaceae bacterium]
MRKHLFVTLLLLSGMPLCGVNVAQAAPEPQSQSQAASVIRGTVLDENNEPVIGASVVQKGTKVAAATDVDGHFSIKVPAGTPLVISYVGYKTMTMPAAADMIVYMQPTTEMLNELVAIGYGSQKRANLTGAVATVDVARTMDARPTSDVTKALQGAVPGLTITTGDGDLTTTSSIKIRGTGSIKNQDTAPLFVVDGVPTDDISFVNPDDIAEISVLKDAASSAVYGARAAFGVILITTKTPNKADRVSVKYSNNFAWSQATVLPQYSSVPNQIRLLMQANNRMGLENELFGMYLDQMLPYAEAWEAQNGGQAAGHREMLPFQSWDNVGDFYQDPTTGATMFYANWDVAGIMFNSAAPSNKHNVSLEGTAGKTSYRLSFGYDSQQGLMTYGSDRKRRYNANALVSTEIFSWLKAGAQFNFGQKVYDAPNMWGNGGNFTYLWRWGSYFGPYGTRRASDGQLYEYRNIASRQQAGDRHEVATENKLQAWMEATIIKGLTLRADFTYDKISINDNRSYLPLYAWNNWTNSAKGPEYMVSQANTYASQSNTAQDMWTVNVYGTYAFTVARDNNFKIMAGGSADRKTYNKFTAQKNVLGNNNLPNLELATGGPENNSQTISNTITRHATAGFFGRINYDYKGIYLLEFNGRYDASSSFPASDQWAFFPSGSIGYRFSEENYFKPIKNWWSNGKIRASWGQIGNQAMGDYLFIETISKITQGNTYTDGIHWITSGGANINQMGTPALVNDLLKWERVETIDAGLDLGFFNNSLNATFDWFQRDTKDMIGPGMSLPAVLGAGTPVDNSAHLRTRGWELGVNWNHSFGDADIYVNANIYDGKTTVVKYGNDNKLLGSFFDGSVYGDIWGFETERYFEESDFVGKDEKGNWIYAQGVANQHGLEQGTFKYGPGDVKFKDLNGDGVINGGDPNMVDENGNPVPVGSLANHGDLKVIGNAVPRYEYSFRVGGAYKGFDIDLFFQGVGKRNYWTTSAFVTPLARGNDGSYANQDSYNKMIFDANNQIIGYEIDQNNDYPCMYGGAAGTGTVSGIWQGRYNFYPQSRYLMNMAYLRFKTLSVGYTLPIDLTRKALIQKARIYFTAENLCMLYNGMKKYPIDPEIGSQWKSSTSYSNGTFGRTSPMMRSFSFGMQITF